jgi:hypothetical protein
MRSAETHCHPHHERSSKPRERGGGISIDDEVLLAVSRLSTKTGGMGRRATLAAFTSYASREILRRKARLRMTVLWSSPNGTFIGG